ncbi:MAG: hypothetical protein ACJ8FS_16575 [Sphingomicrobium sp.]
MIGIFSQSLGVWARDAMAEIATDATGDTIERRLLSPANVKIWNSATQQWVQLVHGPLSGGGNEQQPGNSWLDSAYQSGVGWYWACIEELLKDGMLSSGTPLRIYDWTKGGTMFVSTGAWGVDGDWRKSISGSCYNDMLVDYNAALAALTAEGLTPNWLASYSDLGISTASDASASTFSTDLTTWMSNLRADVIGATCPHLHMLLSSKYGPGGLVPRANYATVRSAMVTRAGADPLFKLFNADGLALEIISSVQDDHPTAGSIEEVIGRQIAWNILGLEHPLKDIPALSPAIPPIRYWEPGSHEGFKAVNPWAAYALQCFDRAGNGDMVVVSGGSVPTRQKTRLGTGTDYRTLKELVFNGTSQFLQSGGVPPFLSTAGGATLVLAVSLPVSTGANKDFYTEDMTSDGGRTFVRFTTDASGHFCVQARNDANTLLATADLGIGVIADGNRHLIVVTWDKTTITAYKDGVVGTSPRSFSGTCTVNKGTLGALYNNGSTTFFSPMTLGAAGIFGYNAGAFSAWHTAKRPYFQRRFLTP